MDTVCHEGRGGPAKDDVSEDFSTFCKMFNWCGVSCLNICHLPTTSTCIAIYLQEEKTLFSCLKCKLVMYNKDIITSV